MTAEKIGIQHQILQHEVNFLAYSKFVEEETAINQAVKDAEEKQVDALQGLITNMTGKRFKSKI